MGAAPSQERKDSRLNTGQVGRFVAGYLIGFLMLPVLLGLPLLAMVASGQFHLHNDVGAAPVIVSGRDLSSAGGVVAVVQMDGESARQACRGVCDDLRFEHSVGGALSRVQVLDPSGACVLCSTLGSADVASAQVWSIGGRPLSVAKTSSR